MWACQKCGENVADHFEVCRNCGIIRDGVVAPDCQKESTWNAACIGLLYILLTLIVTIVVIGGAVSIIEVTAPDEYAKFGTRVTLGNNAIFFSDNATEADAQELGRILTKVGAMGDPRERYMFLLSKSPEGYAVSFLLSAGAWNDPQAVNHFRMLGEQLLSEGFGPPLFIKLCDEHGETKKTIPIVDDQKALRTASDYSRDSW